MKRNAILFLIVILVFPTIFFVNSDDKPIDPMQIIPNIASNGVVVIDDEHNNDYFPASMETIFTDLTTLGYLPFKTSEFGGWNVALKYADYMIINAPQAPFTQEELSTTKSWLENGTRGLLMSSRGDFSDINFASMNDLLNISGSAIRVQDDNVYTTLGSPQEWYVESSTFNNTIPELVSGVSTLKFFSPSSVRTLNSSADIIVYGDPDEYQVNTGTTPDPDIWFDQTADGLGGDSIPLVAHEEMLVGTTLDRIVVVGTTLWADFDYDNDPDDILFLHNIMSYFTTRLIAIDGSINVIVPDLAPPIVKIDFPRVDQFVKGTVTIVTSAIDSFGVNSTEIYIDDVLKSSTTTFSWDTTLEIDGDHFIKFIAKDETGNIGEIIHKVTVDQDFVASIDLNNVKVLEYNIKEGGIDSRWLDVMKEENADIAILVETGNWDDNANELLKTYVDELNGYFTDELPYQGVLDLGVFFATSGVAILSRFPISNFNDINSLTLDSGAINNPTHDFVHVNAEIGSNQVAVIASHLKCCSGADNEEKREAEQEGIINYMDDLGNMPIIYAGDLNSFYPGEVGDLGSGPVNMLIDNADPRSSAIHTFTDVHKQLKPSDAGATYLSGGRIDFIFVNQFFVDLLKSTTTADTASALLGSDHLPIDVTMDLSSFADILPTETSTSSSTTTTSSTTTDTTTSSQTTTGAASSDTKDSDDASIPIRFGFAVLALVIIPMLKKLKK